MKYCVDYALLLDLYADGELSADEWIHVQEHLDACPACRSYVDDALAIRTAFPDAEDTPLPDGFSTRVMSAIHAAPKKTKSGSRWRRVLLPLAACLAISVILQSMLSPATKYETAAAPSMAMVSEPEAAAEEAFSLARTTENDTGAPSLPDDMADGTAAAPAAPAASESLTGATEAAQSPMEFHLTEEEAGDLLRDYTPIHEDAAQIHYALTAEEFTALLEALERPVELPASDPILVILDK